jgi:hypothetical protein
MNTPSSFKRPTHQLARKHLQCIKDILVFADQYSTRYNFIFDEIQSRAGWSRIVEDKYAHLHATLCHIMGRGTKTESCDQKQQTLLLISDVDMCLDEMIQFVKCRIETTRQQIPHSWIYAHRQLLQMSRWVHGLLHAVVPDNMDDVTQGLTDAIHRYMT